MIGGSIQSALAVKNNESNITDTLDWIQQQKVHKLKLRAFKNDLLSAQKEVTKFGGRKCSDIDKQMSLRNQNKRVTSLVNQNRHAIETKRKNIILSNKMKEIFTRRRSFYGELAMGSEPNLLSVSPTIYKGVKNQSQMTQITNKYQFGPSMMLNQSSGADLQQSQPSVQSATIKIQEENYSIGGQPISKAVAVNAGSGAQLAGNEKKEAEDGEADPNKVQEQTETNINEQQTSPSGLTTHINEEKRSDMEQAYPSFDQEQIRKNNQTALTPMNVPNKKGPQDVNSMQAENQKQKDLSMTHQAFTYPKNKDKISTTIDMANKMYMHQQNFGGENSMMKTQTSFQSQVTHPHLYVEVQRPSFLHAMNSVKTKGENSESFYRKNQMMATTGYNSKMSVMNTFHQRHKSLNETSRKNEQMRIAVENNKLLNYMKQLRPSSALQVEKLKQHHKTSQNLKKNIVMTKYSKRHQLQLRQALRLREKIFNELPPVIGPLHQYGMNRRQSSDLMKNKSGSDYKSNQKAPEPERMDTFGDSMQDRQPTKDSKDAGPNSGKPSATMLMNHDSSVQNVTQNSGANLKQRHQSLGGAPNINIQTVQEMPTPSQIYVQEELKFLQGQDPQAFQSPYNYRMDVYSQHHDQNINKQLNEILLHSKNNVMPNSRHMLHLQQNTLTPQMIQQSYFQPSVSQTITKETNQDVNRRRFYGNLINQVSTRDMTPKPTYHTQSGNGATNSGQANLNYVTSSNYFVSSKSMMDQQSASLGEGVSVSVGDQLKTQTNSNKKNAFKTLAQQLPSIKNTYGLYQQVINAENVELQKKISFQKQEAMRIRNQSIMRREKQKLEDIKKYQIALKQQYKDIAANKVKVEDQNMDTVVEKKEDDQHVKKKSPPRIPNKETISWVAKMRVKEAEDLEKGKDTQAKRFSLQDATEKKLSKVNYSQASGTHSQERKMIKELKLQNNNSMSRNKNIAKQQSTPEKQNTTLQIKKDYKTFNSILKPQANKTQIVTPRIQKNKDIKQVVAEGNANPNMNQTMTSFSSNVVKGTVNSQQTTPNIQTIQYDNALAVSMVKDGVAAKVQKMQTDAAGNMSEPSDDMEEDLSQRKKLDLKGPKTLQNSPAKISYKGDTKGSKESKVSPKAQRKSGAANSSARGQLKALDEKGHETTDNYEDYDESNDGKADKLLRGKEGKKMLQTSSESSKMMDSHAKNSDDYESDDFEDDGAPKSPPKNAQEYFQEEEARKSRDTPVGGNPNSDGGSVFNQTGGQFLNRQVTANQTKSSIQKDTSGRPKEQVAKYGSNINSQKSIIDDKNPDYGPGPSTDPQKSKQKQGQIFKNSQFSGTSQDYAVVNQSPKSRYNQYEDAQEGQFRNALADYSVSPPLIKGKEQTLGNQSSKNKVVTNPSEKSIDKEDFLGLDNADQNGPFQSNINSMESKNENKKTDSGNKRYSQEDDMMDKSEKYTDEEDLEPDMSDLVKKAQKVPIVPKRPAVDDDEEYSEDYTQSQPSSTIQQQIEGKKKSLSKYPIPKSFNDMSNSDSNKQSKDSNSRPPLNLEDDTPHRVKKDDDGASEVAKKPLDAKEKKMLTAKLNAQSDSDEDYSNDDFD